MSDENECQMLCTQRTQCTCLLNQPAAWLHTRLTGPFISFDILVARLNSWNYYYKWMSKTDGFSHFLRCTWLPGMTVASFHVHHQIVPQMNYDPRNTELWHMVSRGRLGADKPTPVLTEMWCENILKQVFSVTTLVRSATWIQLLIENCGGLHTITYSLQQY